MTYIGSINCKSGKVSSLIIWMYTIMLKHYGHIISITERLGEKGHIREYIIMSGSGYELSFNINITQGTIDGHMKQERGFTNIYEIGSNKTVERIWR